MLAVYKARLKPSLFYLSIQIKMIMQKFIQVTLSLVVLVCASLPVLAQVPGTGAGAPGAPIDGGASILAAAGVAYGIKKYRDHKKGQQDS